MIKLKIVVLGAFLLFAGCAFFFQFHKTSAHINYDGKAVNPALKEIANYKSWAKITKEPLEVKRFTGGLAV